MSEVPATTAASTNGRGPERERSRDRGRDRSRGRGRDRDRGRGQDVPDSADPEKSEAELAEEALAKGPGGESEIPFELFDPDALKVVRRLRQFGHEAYFVGGCVRDLLLNKKPKDYDVATSAHPNDVRGIFRNCRLIGRRFRLAHVYFKGGKIIEVSTFRANPTEVEEVRRELEAAVDEGVAETEAALLSEDAPAAEEDFLISEDNVFGTAEQDARRRDFTINGLFFDVGTGKVIDYVRGKRDLALRFVRTIGDPEIRLREDPVRILRAVRFASKLDLDIESRTYAAMEGAAEDLPRCAPPRLLEDTFRMVRSGVAAPGIRLLSALDALKFLLPPIDTYLRQHGDVTFYAYAEALDRRTKGGETLEDAVMLATLLVPISQVEPEESTPEGERPSVAKAIEDLLNEFVRTARLPRRIAERCRMILLAQRTLTGERKRRGSLQSFRRHPLFNESMTVFEITVEATGEFTEQLEAWRAGSAPAPAPGAEEAEGTGKKRRRRRRRGAGPKEGTPEGGAPDEGPASGEGVVSADVDAAPDGEPV